jgi:hypothetical protein
MKPDQQQKMVLQQYLSKNLRYKETYDEFYDHIMAAFEAKPADCPFESTTMKIIKDDFGGIEGMRFIEDKYQYSIFTEMRKKYLAYAIENLKFPWILVFGVFAVLVYYTVKQSWFNFAVFLISLMAIRLVPPFLQMVRRFHSNRIYGQPQRSIKSGFFKWLNYIPAIIICLWLVLTPGSFNNSIWIQQINPFAITVLLLLVAFHSVTFYKVYSDDIKTSFNTN